MSKIITIVFFACKANLLLNIDKVFTSKISRFDVHTSKSSIKKFYLHYFNIILKLILY